MQKLISLVIRFVPRKYLQRVSGMGLQIVSLFYLGNRVNCPICQRHYRAFLPYGRLKVRPNALCPSCQSLERHRLIWLYLKEKTNFFLGAQSVLHFAPEACFLKAFEKQHKEGYITADIESPLAKMKVDIHDIPYPENHFDVVLCNHVLEHVEDDLQALHEIQRVLKPGGWAILQVPFFSPVPEDTFENPSITDPRERERTFGQADHVRKYGRDYASRIARSGLSCNESEYAKTVAPRFAVQANEILFIATKEVVS